MRIAEVTVVALVTLLAGCAGNVSSQVKASDKDPAGAYNGNWQAMVLPSASLQYGPENWTFTCSGEPQQFGFSVADSEASVNYREEKHTTYVNKDGKFRFEIPMNVDATAKGISDSSIDRGAMTMIIVGTLKGGTGRLTYGIAQFGNQGCSAKVKYIRS